MLEKMWTNEDSHSTTDESINLYHHFEEKTGNT